MLNRTRKTLLGCSAAVIALTLATQALAQQRKFDIPAQDASTAVTAFGLQAGVQISAPMGKLRGVKTPTVRGDMDTRAALQALLQGTGLVVASDDGRTIVLQMRPQEQGAPSEPRAEVAVEEVLVTGSRIRGAPPTAPVITVTADEIRNAGQADLGEVIRSLPQNAGGGQNPGIGNNQSPSGQSNANVNGASSLNLRGMGPDATLTLLNGSRLSYNSINAAVDISAIPTAAVSRIEILADGASALYGSDAVAGVANVILKRDYDGLTASARLGGSTDGGGTQHQYSLVGGRAWSNGGFIATYDNFHNTRIYAADRSFTTGMHPDTTLYPKIARQSAILSGHQELSNWARISADILYKTGEMEKQTGNIIGQPISFRGTYTYPTFKSFGISPKLELSLPREWVGEISGYYGNDDTHLGSSIYTNGARSSLGNTFYNNAARSAEANVEGRLFSLPGGDARLALGAGYRQNKMMVSRATNGVTSFAYDVAQQISYGFGELSLPLVGPRNRFAFIDKASVTLAGRYEDYRAVDEVFTPKVGLSVDFARDFTFTASWGKSFKAPTFYQQYADKAVLLQTITGYGAAFPAGSTWLYVGGASEDLKPERSKNWTASLRFRPAGIPGADLSVSYFNVDYIDRITTPLSSTVGALTNPLYAILVTRNPSLAVIDAFIQSATTGLQNLTGAPFNPSNVAAILDIRNRNVASQAYEGVDISARYRRDGIVGGAVTLSGSAAYLKSEQQLTIGAPSVALAGTVFSPAQWRARGGAVYDRGNITLSSFVSYTGAVTDNRRAVPVDGSSVTTMDIGGRVRLGHGVEVSANAQNLFNAKPNTIFTSAVTDTSFDTTNYSAIGRYLSVSVTKTW